MATYRYQALRSIWMTALGGQLVQKDEIIELPKRLKGAKQLIEEGYIKELESQPEETGEELSNGSDN